MTIKEDGVLRSDTTLQRLGEWLLANAASSELTAHGDSHAELVRLAPIRHVLAAEQPGHDRANCRACAVSDVAMAVEHHLGERAPWRDVFPFLKEVEAAVATLKALRRSARDRAAFVERLAEVTEPSARMSQEEMIPRLRSAAECHRMDRLLEYAAAELELALDIQLRTFASPDHAMLPRTNPPRPLIKKITRDLSRAGFTAPEIVRLIDDGHEQNLSLPKSKAFEDAVARVYKRLEGPPKDSAPKSFQVAKAASLRR